MRRKLSGERRGLIDAANREVLLQQQLSSAAAAVTAVTGGSSGGEFVGGGCAVSSPRPIGRSVGCF